MKFRSGRSPAGRSVGSSRLDSRGSSDRPVRWAPIPPLVVLAGYAGAGKTDVLRALATLREQTLDLEGLARHRGSAFGRLGQPAQPSSQEFQRLVHDTLSRMDPARRLWIEDEGAFIGRVQVPPALRAALETAVVVRLERPFAERVARLAADYGRFPAEELASAVGRTKRLGPDRTEACLTALGQGRLDDLVGTLLSYFDACYAFRHTADVRPCAGTIDDDRLDDLGRARAALAALGSR
jgi:tRNA 2-selenouridine synthase